MSLLDFIGPTTVIGVARGAAGFARNLGKSSIDEVGNAVDFMSQAAKVAIARLGPGKGPGYGTKVHKEVEDAIKALRNSNFSAEVSYKNGIPVARGTPGSVRIDGVVGPQTAPKCCLDLKTGAGALDANRVRQIQNHLPGGSNVPVLEVRP